jgi:hypothetical protein
MNRNTLLLIVVIFTGIVGFFVVNNNISLKNLVKTDGYTPMGRPTKTWESQWEIERAK